MECIWCTLLFLWFLPGALGTNTVGFPTLPEILDPQGDEESPQRPIQWLFPKMRFTCAGTITAWIFRDRKGSWKDTFGQFEIWQPNRVNPSVYTLVNSTAITEPEQIADAVYQEVLDSPIEVKENDTVGIRVISSNCRRSIIIPDAGLSAPAAYFRNDDVGNPIFSLDLARRTRRIIPLFTPVISSSPVRSSTTRSSTTLNYPQPTLTNTILPPTTENTVPITNTVTELLLRGPSLSPSPNPQNPDAATEAHSKDPVAIVGITAGVGAVLVIGIMITCATVILTVTCKVRSCKTSTGNQSVLFISGQHGERRMQSPTNYTEYTPPTTTRDIDIATNEAYGVVHISPQALGPPIATSGSSQNHRYGVEEQVSTTRNEAYGALQAGQTVVMDDGLYMNSESMYDEPQI